MSFIGIFEGGNAHSWVKVHALCMPSVVLHQNIPPINPRHIPLGVIITSPNMDYILDFSHDYHDIWIQEDGCYYVHDFTLYPQWYFKGTYYMSLHSMTSSPKIFVRQA